MKKIAFQGVKGAYSEMAIEKHFTKDFQAIGFDLSEEVCFALEEGKVDIGVLPVENSIVGNVSINMDLLLKHHFYAIGEVYLGIQHCLLAIKGAKLSEITSVHSHPIALDQCIDFLKKHKIRPVPDFDTAGAARELKKNNILSQATISSSLCSEHYGLEIISDNIQKVQHNYTRFIIFVKSIEAPKELKQEKTSLAFTTNHNPGALLNCLQEFSKMGLNLTKIESRPIPENPFMYTFFVDFHGALDDTVVQECLRRLKKDTLDIKILGSYPLGIKDF